MLLTSAVQSTIEANKQLVALDWDRTHSLNFTNSRDTGDFITGFYWKLGSGLPYTPSLQSENQFENSEIRPSFLM